MALNIPGLVVTIVFYVIMLATGIWAAWKTKKEEKNANRSEVAMVGGRNMNIFVGLFTTTGGLFFVKPMRSKSYVTMMDPLQETYGNTMGTLLFLPTLIGDVFWFAAILSALGATMSVILDIRGYLAIIISACTVTLYTLLGGLYSVAYTDVIQLVFMMVSLWTCVPFALLNSATESIYYTAVNEFYQVPWIGKLETEYLGRWLDELLYVALGSIPWQSYFQRVLAASSSRQARLTSYFAGFGCFFMVIPSVLIGAVAASTDWNQTSYGLPTPNERGESSMILPIVLQYLCPTYVSVAGLGAIAAAVMSSADSALLSASSMLAHNIYRKILRKKPFELCMNNVVPKSLRAGECLHCGLVAYALPAPDAKLNSVAPGGVSLLVPQPNINATVAQNILLSVEYSCKGIVSIEWKHVSSWGTNKIVEWKPGSYTNISKSYKDRVNTYENGSIQLLNVGVRDAGYYVVTITEELGTNIYGTIVLTVYEIIYEDLHFVAVFFAFLTAVSAVLVCCMWFCNKSVHLFQNKRDKLKERTAEEIELQTIEC
ncbi:High affinity choline transporter 1 [Chelonia mydas]|uniref:High affinity choline transporter 1 n=1 Tax=Chelonia mydas TaxID=8469 RepID=M7BEK4_CHEMY|nr:High affinity choline transporter 1 [Chelonia mydas]